MGTWGTAIFSDDTAADVKDDFEDLIRNGHDAAEATCRLMAEWADTIDDPDEAPVFWLALAAVQVKTGRLQDFVRDRALDVIDTGVDLRRWEDDEEASRRDVEKRRTHLEKLRHELTGPQKAPTKLRKPSTYVEVSEWAVGDHWAYRLGSGRWIVFRVVAIDVRSSTDTPLASVDETWPGTLPVVEVLDQGWRHPPALEEAENARPRQGRKREDDSEPVHALVLARATQRDFPTARLQFVGRSAVDKPHTGIAARLRRRSGERRTELCLWKWLDRDLAERWDVS